MKFRKKKMPAPLSQYHTVPGTYSSNAKPLGLIAFLIVGIPGLLLIAMIIVGNIFIPCDTGLGVSLTPFGCDTETANEYRFYQSLVSLAFMIAIPVSIILGIVAIVKGDGSGWGLLSLVPLPIVVAVSFISYTLSKAAEY